MKRRGRDFTAAAVACCLAAAICFCICAAETNAPATARTNHTRTAAAVAVTNALAVPATPAETNDASAPLAATNAPTPAVTNAPTPAVTNAPAAPPPPLQTGGLVVASWNIENLFDADDDPDNEGDDGFTPRGWMRWTKRRYSLKLIHLAEIIAEMRPQILCLAEVENRRVLEDLSRTLKTRFRYELPVILHREGTDQRGIDIAMLAARKPDRVEWILPAFGQRDILAATFTWDGRPLTVLANHWKSQLGEKKKSDEIRKRCALAARGFVDKLLKKDPAAAILAAGDFNDVPDSPALLAAGFVADEKRVLSDPSGRLFFNLSATRPGQDGMTYYYSAGRKWSAMDMMHVSRGMWDGTAPWRVRRGSFRVYKQPKQCTRWGAPLPFRRIRRKGHPETFATGYSDHFPILVELVSEKHGE